MLTTRLFKRAIGAGRTAQEVSEALSRRLSSRLSLLNILDPDTAQRTIEAMLRWFNLWLNRATHTRCLRRQNCSFWPWCSGRDQPRRWALSVDDETRHPFDFALWKAAKPGEPSWPSSGEKVVQAQVLRHDSSLPGHPTDIHGGAGPGAPLSSWERDCAGYSFAPGTLPSPIIGCTIGMLRVDEKMSLGNFTHSRSFG